jgi:MFS family permease
MLMTSDINQESNSADDKQDEQIGGSYARYVLGVLVIVYIFNFIDRQILSILAEDIKADLGISDSQIGFLYGTAFAVFYAIFGLPLGKLADVWTRKNLISLGLTFWSLMTALSGTARGFGSLAVYRIGVGIGEASATPAAFSMLSDYFPPRVRATILAIYSSGVYIGAGIGIFLGGLIVDLWNSSYPDPMTAPLGLKGWHVAFFAVGIPGLLMAIWVATLKEPKRGQSEGLITEPHAHPFREAWLELKTVIPLLNLAYLLQLKCGMKGLVINLLTAAGLAILAYALVRSTGSEAQWIALSVGVYCSFSWAQALALKDPATFNMIFRCKTIVYSCLGFPCIAFITYGLGFWGPSFFQRVHEVSAAEAGMVLGLSAAIGGWLGVTGGGFLADRLRHNTRRGKLYVGLFAAISSFPISLGLLLTDSVMVAYTLNFLFAVVSPMWVGPAASTINDLVLPRMRAVSSAFYILMITFIGLALGPYMMGWISDSLADTGLSSAESLRQGMLWGLIPLAFAVLALIMAMLNVEDDENTRLDRARLAGEDV